MSMTPQGLDAEKMTKLKSRFTEHRAKSKTRAKSPNDDKEARIKADIAAMEKAEKDQVRTRLRDR